LNALVDEEERIEDFLRKAMPVLGFRVFVNLRTEEGRLLTRTFHHGIRKARPSLTESEAMEIVYDLATSGESYAWPDKFARGFFTALRSKVGMPVGAAAVKPLQDFTDSKSCEVCDGQGIAILPKMYGPGSAACVCKKGRFYFSCWIKDNPRIVDLELYPHVVEHIIREQQPAKSLPAGTPAELIRYFKTRLGRSDERPDTFLGDSQTKGVGVENQHRRYAS
jgi:hypothetical protein